MFVGEHHDPAACVLSKAKGASCCYTSCRRLGVCSADGAEASCGWATCHDDALFVAELLETLREELGRLQKVITLDGGGGGSGGAAALEALKQMQELAGGGEEDGAGGALPARDEGRDAFASLRPPRDPQSLACASHVHARVSVWHGLAVPVGRRARHGAAHQRTPAGAM